MIELIQVASEEEALAVATHRHYKGGLYRFVGEGVHTETGETLVAYAHVWPHKPSLFFRPADIFYGILDDGTRRFAPTGN